MNRSKKAAINLLSQLILYIVTAICGLIVPKLLLDSFGSDVHGLTTSISQFLGLIAIMESGFGHVAKTAFYKPLASGDRQAISGVYNATESFFRKLALIFAGYCVILALIFPLINDSGFDFWFTATLVLIVSITSFVQYYFGMSYMLALNADQLSFISAFLQVGTIILNAILVWLMIKIEANIHLVKLVSASVFILKPVAINAYGRYRYRIDKRVPKDNNSLSQKWDNMAQGIASYIHNKAPFILITIFLTYSDVSIYSVFSLVTRNLMSVITSVSTGFVSGLGNMYAKGEKETFRKVFSLYEFVNTLLTVGVFTIAGITIMQFVDIYTASQVDVNYHQPILGFFLVLGELIYCLRLPYYYAIANIGHFKQTKRGAYIEAILCVVISLCLLPFIGILGPAIGTIVAMAFRTTELIVYCSKHVTEIKVFYAIKRIVINALCAVISIVACSFIKMQTTNFFNWAVYASIVSVVTFVIMFAFNLIFYKDDVKLLLQKIKSVFFK